MESWILGVGSLFMVDSMDVVDSLRATVLPEVVVSGRRGMDIVVWDRLDAQLVMWKNPSTSADWLGHVGGVYVQKSQLGGGSPMIRGLAANRILYAVEGVRMNTAIFRGGNLHNVILLSPWLMDEAEVMMGVASVGYGSDAMGGVLSFRFLRPRFIDSVGWYGWGGVRGGSAAYERGGYGVVAGGTKQWAWLGGIACKTLGDVRMGALGRSDFLRTHYVERVQDSDRVVPNDHPLLQVPTGFSQCHVLGRLRKRTLNGDIDYTFYYTASSDIPRYDRLLPDTTGNFRYAEWYYGPMRWIFQRVGRIWRFSHRWQPVLEVQGAYQRMEESRHRRLLGNIERKSQYEMVDVASVNVDVQMGEVGDWSMRMGAEGVWNRVRSVGKVTDISSGAISGWMPRYPTGWWYSGGIYALGRYRWSPQWEATGGIRWNAFGLDVRFDTGWYPLSIDRAVMRHSAWAWGVGVRWQAWEMGRIWLQLGSGFRAPNVDDVGKVFDSEPGSVLVPNPSLKAERAYTLELHSLVWNSGGQWRWKGGVYYTWLDDVMIRRPYRWAGWDSMEYEGVMSQIMAIQNGAYGWIWGSYGEVSYHVGTQWELRIRSDWQRGREWEEGGVGSEPMRHVVPVFGRLEMRRRVKRWQVGMWIVFSGGRHPEEMPPSERKKVHIYPLDSLGRPYVEGWWTLNGRGMWHVSDHITITVGIDNLMDRRYWPYGWGMAAPGRDITLQLRIKF